MCYIRFIMMYISIFFHAIIACIKSLKRGDRANSRPLNSEKAVFILGNGPSLKKIDLSKIPSNISIACVNSFAIYNDLFFTLKPKYYVIIDRAYFLPENFVHEGELSERRKLYSKLEQVDWDMCLITPQRSIPLISNPHIRCEKINISILYSDHSNSLYNYLFSKNLAICGLQNVLVGALYYFVMKKVPIVYLAGADMNEFLLYKVGVNNHVFAEYTHFYGVNYMDCTENGTIKNGEFSKWIGLYSKMFKEFKLLSEFAKYQNVKIINCTLESYIDVFEKKDWKEIVYGKK